MNQNFNAVKKLATIVALVALTHCAFAQVKIYKEGQLQAIGTFVSASGNIINMRSFESGRINKRAFFQNSLDSIVFIDSLTISEVANIKFRCPVVLRQEVITYSLKDVLPAPAEAPAPAVAIPRLELPTEAMQQRMAMANKHVNQATTSMIGSFAVGLAGAVIVSDIASRATTEGQLRDASVASFALGGLSLGLLINALVQNSKANNLLRIK